MDLLPSHEELDNTGFRAADKKSMLALIGSHSTDRSSPPPGYIPDALQQVARNGSFTSINSEGEFIPESMDQVASGTRLHTVIHPHANDSSVLTSVICFRGKTDLKFLFIYFFNSISS